MAAGNKVILTFTSETKSAEEGMDRVGRSSVDMEKKVHKSADGFDRVGEAADEVDTKAMGFRDTMTGVQDTMGGVSMIMKGNLFEGFLTLGMGIGDLGSAFYNFLIPSMKSAVGWLRTTRVGTLAAAASQKIAAVASKVWAAGQWLLNAALTANPIGIVVVAIAALVAGFIYAWKHSETFRKIVIGAWNGIKGAALAVWHWMSGTLWPGIRRVVDGVASAFRGLPGRIGAAFRNVARIISAPFRAAFNAVSTAWNATVGRLNFRLPALLGGAMISAPRLPHFHSGGVVPGPRDQEVLAVLRGQERVIADSAGGSARGGTTAIMIRSDGSRFANAVVELLDKAVRDRGLAIGASNA